MAAAEEIAIKLGIKTGDFKSALSDAGASIKSFKKEAETGGLSAGNIFGKLADKVGGLRDVTSTLAVALGLSLEKISEKVARAIVGLSEAEEVAMKKFVELQTRNTDEAIKQIKARGTAEQQYQSALVERASLQKKIEEFNTMEVKLVAGIADEYGRDIIPATKTLVVSQEKLLELEELKTRQLTSQSVITAYESKKAEERKTLGEAAAKNEYENSIKMRDSTRELMSLYERRKSLLSEEAALSAVIAVEDRNTKEYAQDTNRLLAVQKQILDANHEVSKGISLGEKEDLELFRLKVKAKQAETDETKILTIAERARLLTLQLQTETQQRSFEVSQLYAKMLNGTIKPEEEAQLKRLLDRLRLQDLYGKQLDGTITPAEKSELAVLIQQSDEIGIQLRKKLDVINATEKQAVAANTVAGSESAVTKELEKQVRLAKEAADEEERREAALEQFLAHSIGQKGDVRNLSNVQLDALQQKLQKQLDEITREDKKVQGPGTIVGFYTSLEQNLARQNLNQVIAEIDERRNFQRTANFLGGTFNERNYAPDEFARLSQLFNPDQQRRDSQNLSTVALGLQSMFPDKFTGAIR